jgi:HEAT repeats
VRTLGLTLVLSAACFAQGSQPTVTNAKFESKALSGTLKDAIRSDSPHWFGYAVKAAPHSDGGCCWGNGSGAGCGLEGRSSTTVEPGAKPKPVELEGPSEVGILFRVENRAVGKVQVYSLGCPLDAGRLPFTWLTGVPADASLRYLESQVSNSTTQSSNGAMLAISRHAGPEPVQLLANLSKSAASTHVRSQALFWLAERAGRQAIAAITDAIQNDPDTKVKRQAVFALSRLPKDEGVPKLIEIAKTQKNPEVRKQAFFWLGQSRDPRAIAFFESVLSQ